MVGSKPICAAALLAVTAAQTTPVAGTTVTSLLLHEVAQEQRLEASVIDAGKDATTYFINCAQGSKSTGCIVGDDGVTLTQGPSMVREPNAWSEPGASIIGLAECSIDAESSLAGCRTELTSIVSGSTFTETGYTLLTPYQNFMSPVTVTAGLEKISLSSSSSSAPTTPSPSAASKTLSTALTTTTSNVAPMMTQNAAALAGVVAVAGALAL